MYSKVICRNEKDRFFCLHLLKNVLPLDFQGSRESKLLQFLICIYFHFKDVAGVVLSSLY